LLPSFGVSDNHFFPSSVVAISLEAAHSFNRVDKLPRPV
jgi:hypothetical protein